ncbi:MAG TPA: flagellar export chaperone FliS [Terriglobales bacterium]|nr:flagellar export chaperone FliS [Terriglobales bacterium]
MNIQQSYREAAARGASPVDLVVRLYEQIIEDLRQVAIAIEQDDIKWRTQRIKHAILIVGHLQSSLDFVRGGKVAKDLDHFYNTLRQSLVQVQFFPSKHGVAQLITDLLAVREAWIKVERAESPSAANSAGVVPSAAPDPDSDHARMGWKG